MGPEAPPVSICIRSSWYPERRGSHHEVTESLGCQTCQFWVVIISWNLAWCWVTCQGWSRLLRSLGWVWLSPPGGGRPWRRPAQRRGRAGEMPYHSYIFYVYINSWTEGSMTTPEFRKPMLHRLCNSRDFQDFSYLLRRYGKTLIIFISVGI